ncbi:carboxymuconolactone decarboxylase family protein [Streptomyces sp. NBC_00233]|uniref:carboxymuconolactone decarboxylase family protein n=1 Tax=Streptomyces sp. NBC_00233 TaxID=2975686 RepID=UPI00225BB53F|nr:carboxymuconolactone decarboxylase family protein [Streptomyces sp. NBC_00233]MCX5226299.1 carboxymuconolactone decarboxylase family protein [Streptomyces sp. NBC_00233]
MPALPAPALPAPALPAPALPAPALPAPELPTPGLPTPVPLTPVPLTPAPLTPAPLTPVPPTPALRSVDPERATGETASLFTATHRALGVVPQLARVMANNPTVLRGYVDVVTALSTRGTLSADVRERIALLVAQENRSDYCLSVHTFRGTKVAGLTTAEAARARRGEAEGPWAAAVLDLAAAVVRHHGVVSDERLAAARHAGLSDGHVVEIIAHVALGVFTNHLATAARIDIDWPLVRHTDGENAMA